MKRRCITLFLPRLAYLYGRRYKTALDVRALGFEKMGHFLARCDGLATSGSRRAAVRRVETPKPPESDDECVDGAAPAAAPAAPPPLPALESPRDDASSASEPSGDGAAPAPGAGSPRPAETGQLLWFSTVWKPNLQPDFNVSVFECFDTSSSAGLRELDESDRSVQKSAESTSI